MGITVDVVEFTLNTSTGTQDITGSLGGLTPKAALFFVVAATVDGTAAAHASMSIGAATGASNEWAFHSNAEDAQATTDTYRATSSARCILLTDPGIATVDMDAEFSAFITNGVRINIATASSAYKGICILFAGSDLTVHANNVGLGNTVDLETNITAPGFEPELVFAAAVNKTTMDADGANAEISFGIVHNGVSITQRQYAWFSNDAVAAGAPNGEIRNDSGIGGEDDWTGEFANFDASGFSVITRTDGGNSTDMGYLALDFNGVVGVSLDSEGSPTSIGNDSTTNPGFTPQAVIGLQSYMQAFNTNYEDADAGAWGVLAFTSSVELCAAIADEKAAATTNTQSYINTKAIDVPNDDGTVALTAPFVSMDANGYTLNWTDVEAAARQGFFVAIEAVSGDTTISVSDTVGITESVAIDLPDDLTLSVSDSIAVSESITVSLPGLTLTMNVSDAVGVAESVAIALPGLTLTVNVSDAVGVAESIEQLVTSDANVSDNVSAGESVAIILPDNLTFSISDAIGVAETLKQLLTSFIQVSDSINVIQMTELAGPVVDLVSVAESIQMLVTSFTDVSDTVTAGESVDVDVPSAGGDVSVSDAVGVSESTSVSVSDPQVSVSSSIGVAETVSAVLPDNLTLSISETISISEAITVVIGQNVSAQDAVAVSESVATTLPDALALNVSDSIGVAESVTVALAVEFTFTVSEAIALTESITTTLSEALALDISDAAAVAESIEQLLISLVAVSDTVSATESIEQLLESLIDVSDAAGIAESIEQLVTSSINISGAVSVAEQITGVVTSYIDKSDSVSVAESVTVAVVSVDTEVSATESISVTDTPLITLPDNLTLGISDTISIAESISLGIVTPDLTLLVTVSTLISLAEDITMGSVLIDQLTDLTGPGVSNTVLTGSGNFDLTGPL